MRADAIAFKDIFQVDRLSGRISLGTSRYVTLDAAAVGNMRRELMDNLGWEVTRGILGRVGHQCGCHDAHQMRDNLSGMSDEECVRAGFHLFYLEGMVKVEITEFDVNPKDQRLIIKGEWQDSFEAEQHLKHYGAGSRSACWMLEGYAGGYVSEFFGEDIVCIETHCRAKGDPTCRFELRSAVGWGKTAHPIQEMLATTQFTERFDRCLRMISDQRCELEQTSLSVIITTDARGHITSCSQGACEKLGISSREAIGKQISDFYSGGKAEIRSIMEHLKQQRRLRNHLTELVSVTGRKTPIALSASAIYDRSGNIIGVIGVGHDLTGIRRLEDELTKKNRFMANILRDSADAIITMNPQDIVTSWNKGAESIFGYRASEMIGKSINIIVPPELRKSRELESVALKFQAQGAVRNFQTERITKDGRRIQIIFTRTAIRDDNGNVAGSSSVVKDVSSIRNLEKQLADTEHLATLGELSAGLAHEIKNPLAGIKGAIDVIRDSPSISEIHREVLGDVIHEVNRIDKIVRDLLNYAKPKPPSHSSIDLPELAQRILAMASSSSKHSSIPIRLVQKAPIPRFTGDETQLEQILQNLLLNAQNAMPPSGGHIEVVLDYNNESYTIYIDVKDDGPGIPEDIRKRIFLPFFTTRTDGAGLGLATCLKNVQYHGGSIEVHSMVGKGTEFHISIPLISHI
jgi:PAS domain S-box-containing protein